MKTKYEYDVVLQDGAVYYAGTRQEARQMKSLYEGIYKGKVNILRYENPAKIR